MFSNIRRHQLSDRHRQFPHSEAPLSLALTLRRHPPDVAYYKLDTAPQMAQKDAKSCQKCQFCERENWNPPICFWVAWVSYMSCPELHWWCCSNLDHCRSTYIFYLSLPILIGTGKLPSSEEMILPQCPLAEEMSFQVNQGTWLGEGVPSVDRKLLGDMVSVSQR